MRFILTQSLDTLLWQANGKEASTFLKAILEHNVERQCNSTKTARHGFVPRAACTCITEGLFFVRCRVFLFHSVSLSLLVRSPLPLSSSLFLGSSLPMTSERLRASWTGWFPDAGRTCGRGAKSLKLHSFEFALSGVVDAKGP